MQLAWGISLSAVTAMAQNDDSELLFDLQGHVATVTFNRPRVHNAITWAMYRRLIDLCDQVDADDGIRVMVLRGAGKAFSAGTDISQFRELKDPADALEYEQKIDKTLDRVESVTKPTIAVLRAACTGGGALIALACDFRYSHTDLRFGVPIARTLGNCLSMRNYARLVDLLGPAQTKSLLMLARLLDADEALKLGVVHQIVPSEQMDSHVRKVAARLCDLAPLTLQATKEAVRRTLAQRQLAREDGHDLIRSCYMSEDFAAAVQAFLEKRRHEWTGR